MGIPLPPGEGVERRVGVRAERDAKCLRKSLLSRADRTLTPTPLPKGEGLAHDGHVVTGLSLHDFWLSRSTA